MHSQLHSYTHAWSHAMHWPWGHYCQGQTACYPTGPYPGRVGNADWAQYGSPKLPPVLETTAGIPVCASFPSLAAVLRSVYLGFGNSSVDLELHIKTPILAETWPSLLTSCMNWVFVGCTWTSLLLLEILLSVAISSHSALVLISSTFPLKSIIYPSLSQPPPIHC